MEWLDFRLEFVLCCIRSWRFSVIAAGNAPKDWVVDQIRKVKEATDKPFAVNVMLLSPFVEEIAQAVCEEGVKVVNYRCREILASM